MEQELHKHSLRNDSGLRHARRDVYRELYSERKVPGGVR